MLRNFSNSKMCGGLFSFIHLFLLIWDYDERVQLNFSHIFKLNFLNILVLAPTRDNKNALKQFLFIK